MHWIAVSFNLLYSVSHMLESSPRIVVTENDSLAMAELTTLTAAIYRTYRTALEPDMDGAGPGITSRFEVFHDITISNVKVSLGRTPYVDDN